MLVILIFPSLVIRSFTNAFSSLLFLTIVSQISYSLVVILELSGVLEVQYKEIMMSSINKNN